jgi:hypothetical protein
MCDSGRQDAYTINFHTSRKASAARAAIDFRQVIYGLRAKAINILRRVSDD